MGFSSIIIDLCCLSAYSEYIKFNFISSISCTNLMKTLLGTGTLDCVIFLCGSWWGNGKWEIVTAVLWNTFHQITLPTRTYFAFLADICSSLSLYNINRFFASSNNTWWINHHIFHTITLYRCLYLDVLVPLLSTSSFILSEAHFLFALITPDGLPTNFLIYCFGVCNKHGLNMQQKYMWEPQKPPLKMVSTGNGSVECAGAYFKFICSVNFWSILDAGTLDKRAHTVLHLNTVYPT
jgi:hypothetical protein